MGAGAGPGMIQLCRQGFIKHLIHQAGLSGAGDAGDTGKGPQRNGHVDALQIIFPGSPHRQKLSTAGPAAGRDGYFFDPGQVLAGDGTGAGHDILQGPRRHDFTPVHAGPGAYIHDKIRRPHGILVVLHHHQGISQIPQML